MTFAFARRLVSSTIRHVPRRRTHQSYRPRMESLEARLALTAGALDPNFGTDGKVLTDFTLPLDLPGIDSGRQVAIQQADGKIVLAGSSQNFQVGARAIALARYNIDGSL